MQVNRYLRLNDGDLLNAFRDFLSVWWMRVGLGAVLGPVESPDGCSISPEIIEEPSGLQAINPFAPVMVRNGASVVREFIEEHDGRNLAVILRPCELRTMVELEKKGGLAGRPGVSQGYPTNLTVVGVDCLATYPAREYRDRVEKAGLGEAIRELMALAAGSGLSPKAMRLACRMCHWPAPRHADLTIGTIGAVPHDYMLVMARDENTDQSLGLKDVTDGAASEAQVARRESCISEIVAARAGYRTAMMTSDEQEYNDLCSLLGSFARCSLCADCLDACPLYQGEFSSVLGLGSSELGSSPLLSVVVSISRWLASCSGCGVCEEVCECGVPLAMITSSLSHRVQSQLQYEPGNPATELPWA